MKYLEWIPSKKRYRGSHLCVQLNYPASKDTPADYELALVGKYGEIWRFSDELDRVVTPSSRIARKIAGTLGIKPFQTPTKDDESVFTFPTERLPEIMQLLRVPRNRKSQAAYANSF